MAFALLCLYMHGATYDEWRKKQAGGVMPQSKAVFSQVSEDIKNKKYSRAMARLSTISIQHSKNLTYLKYLAITLKGLSDVRALILTLKAIVNIDPSVDNQIELMDALYKDGQINAALDIGLQLHEKNLTVYQSTFIATNLIKIFIEENDFEGVQEVVSKMKDDFKNNSFVCWAEGLVLLARNEKNEALIMFRRSIDLDRNNDQAWVSLALLHQEMGDIELALANLETALDYNPMNQAAIKLYSLWTQKKSDKAKTALDRIQFYLAENEFDEEISLCHVQILCQLQSWKMAHFEVEKLILTHPQNHNYYELKKNLGQNLNL